jgi:outer membrane protein, multidrug efflux system
MHKDRSTAACECGQGVPSERAARTAECEARARRTSGSGGWARRAWSRFDAMLPPRVSLRVMREEERWLVVAMLTVGAVMAAGAMPMLARPLSAQAAPSPTVAAQEAASAGRPSADTEQIEAFWSALGDPVLNRLVQQAISGGPGIRAATARREGAEASREGASLDLLPAVRADAGYTRQRIASASFPGAAGAFPDQDVYSSGLSATYELDLFGRVRSDLRAKDAAVAAGDQDVRSARLVLAVDVARGYFDLRGAQHQLEVARKNAENQKHTLDLTNTRLEAGRGNELDVERAKAQLALTESAIPMFEAQIKRAEYRIANTVGRPAADVARELEAVAALPSLPAAAPAVSVDDVLRARPDLGMAREQVTASRALAGSVRADLRPRVSLGADAGYAASAVDAFGSSGTFNYRVGAMISWAALDIGHVKARVEQAEAFEREANARYEQVELRVREQLASAEATYEAARARVAKLRDAAAASQRAAELATLRYEGGISDFLQVLDAERTLLASQDLLAQAEAQAAAAYVGVFEARGGR